MSRMQLVIAVRDQSQIGDARRQAVNLAEESGFDETGRGRVALAVTELATNLMRYGMDGQILLRGTDTPTDQKMIEITSIDRGPGMADIRRCLTDGYSTGGTSGTGLGAVQRQCETFDIYSSVPGGTVIYCRIAQNEGAIAKPGCCVWNAINVPTKYEVVCGDTWRVSEAENKLAVLIVDGLGHGPDAAAAANAAAEVFDRGPFIPLTLMFEQLHAALRGTRGGAVAVAHVDLEKQILQYVGLGNIAGSLRSSVDGKSRGLFSHNGIVGGQAHRIQQFEYPCPAQSLLILHSDGLQTRWTFDKYPGLSQRHPGIITAVLFRDFCRGNDDVTVAAFRTNTAGSRT